MNIARFNRPHAQRQSGIFEPFKAAQLLNLTSKPVVLPSRLCPLCLKPPVFHLKLNDLNILPYESDDKQTHGKNNNKVFHRQPPQVARKGNVTDFLYTAALSTIF